MGGLREVDSEGEQIMRSDEKRCELVPKKGKYHAQGVENDTKYLARGVELDTIDIGAAVSGYNVDEYVVGIPMIQPLAAVLKLSSRLSSSSLSSPESSNCLMTAILLSKAGSFGPPSL